LLQKVGGIYANNTDPAEFINQNLMMEANVIHEAFVSGVKQRLFLGIKLYLSEACTSADV